MILNGVRYTSPAVALFGFGHDEVFAAAVGEPWPGVAEAERQVAHDASTQGLPPETVRRQRTPLRPLVRRAGEGCGDCPEDERPTARKPRRPEGRIARNRREQGPPLEGPEESADKIEDLVKTGSHPIGIDVGTEQGRRGAARGKDVRVRGAAQRLHPGPLLPVTERTIQEQSDI